ncbi:MAG: OPT/YSL family transporter [Polyangiales bacterium]
MSEPAAPYRDPPSPDAAKPYREVTFAGVLLGVIVGVVMTVSFTYAGLKLGFTVPASMVSAMLGWGVLRGLLRKGSIVENNINQTVAAAINVSSAGVIFTVPVLYLAATERARASAQVQAAARAAHLTVEEWIRAHPDRVQTIPTSFLMAIAAASLAGAVLGVLFIIPSRKQMIELERLVFPSGVATAAILKASGAGQKRARNLVYGILFAIAFATLQGLPGVMPTLPWRIPEDLDLSAALGIPAWFAVTLAVAGGLTSLGGGYITGRAGLVLMVGAVIGHWIVTPLVVSRGWIPAQAMANIHNVPATVVGAAREAAIEGRLGSWAYRNVTRPLGVGMLLGGSIASVILTAPMLASALKSIRQQRARGGSSQELSPTLMWGGIAAGFVVLFVAGYLGAPEVGVGRVMLAAVLSTAWMWLANIIVSITTGKTDNSPLSGMALITILITLTTLGRSAGGITVSVLMAVAVCVATGQGSDMMQDLKTGHLVGALPRRQQLTQLAVAWVGPLVSLLTLMLLAKKFVFGNDPLTAPQAQAIRAAIDIVAPPLDADDLQRSIAAATKVRYLVGAGAGLVMTLGAGGGLGVVLGLAMYLPMSVTLTYSLGCGLAVLTEKRFGRQWVEDVGVPISAGFLVGEGLAQVVLVGADLARVAMASGGAS